MIEGQQKKVLCGFETFSVDRPGLASMKPDKIDTSLCTHIVVSYASLNADTLTIQGESFQFQYGYRGKYVVPVKGHPPSPFPAEVYKATTALKNNGTKVLISMGGWPDSGEDKYSRLVSNATTRMAFAQHAVTFLQSWGFDGLVIEWAYPKCWQNRCDQGPDSDKPNFALWLKDIKEAFEPQGLELGVGATPLTWIAEKAYDFQALEQHLDFVVVKTYDYRGHWDNQAGFSSPLHDPDGGSSCKDIVSVVIICLSLRKCLCFLSIGVFFELL